MRLPSVARNHKFLFSLAITFTILDIVTTYAALTHPSGMFVEANPFMQYLFSNFGFAAMIPVKLGVILAVTETKTLADKVEDLTSFTYTGWNKKLNDYCRENYDYLVLTMTVLVTGSIVVNNLLGLYFV